MIACALLLLSSQAGSSDRTAEFDHQIAVSATASVAILTGTSLDFENWEALVKDSSPAVQVRKDTQGTIWIEFT